MESVLLDVAGHRRSPATLPGYHRGRPPRNKGEQYPADPPTVEEVIAVMRSVGDRPDGYRLRAVIVLLWRAGLRISEALAARERPRPHPRRRARPTWEGRQAPRGRDGPLGVGPARPVAGDPPRASDRRDVVRDPRSDRRTTLGSVRGAQTVASRGRDRRPETAVCAPPTATRARSRDGARGCAARRDPAATRIREPWHHEHLPAGHRQQRDRRHRPRTSVSDDLRQRRSPDEAIDRSAIGSAWRSPGRPDATPPGWRESACVAIGGARDPHSSLGLNRSVHHP